jgi:17beta-estradiol 17-dehydrogenase / very-long-chain 3-oxoacyl-CoA reductase
MQYNLALQVPLFVDTKMLSNAAEGGDDDYRPLVMVSPDGYARAAVRWIGHGPLCIPHVAHQIQSWSISFLPEFIVNFFCLRQVLQLRETILRRGQRNIAGADRVTSANKSN